MVGRVGSREQTDLHFIDWTKQRLRAGSALSKVTRGIGDPHGTGVCYCVRSRALLYQFLALPVGFLLS